MKWLGALVLSVGLMSHQSWGQGAQADQIKRRAKELSNQNNVRQGAPPPAQPAKQPVAPQGKTATAKPITASPASLQQQNISKLTGHFAAIKPGVAVTPEQKQQLIKDMIGAARGPAKPSVAAVTKYVNDLAEALGEKSLGSADQNRLAQNVEAVLNGERLPSAQFDAIIEDVQAILQVGGTKRNLAITIANDLKAVGSELRKAPAK
jgi:hypothetical protein